MASFNQLPSGKWRASVYVKGIRKTKAFKLKGDAKRWAADVESQLAQSISGLVDSPAPLSDLIDKFVTETVEKGRTRTQMLNTLKAELGRTRLNTLSQAHVQNWANKQMARSSATTTAGYLSTLANVLDWGRKVRQLNVSGDICRAVRAGLTHSGHSTRSQQRDRIPTDAEMQQLYDHWDSSPRQTIPMPELCRFAIASCMRLGEITRITFEDLDRDNQTVIIRQRKDPKEKKSNDQTVPLLGEAWEIIKNKQGKGRIFKYDASSVSTAFTRAVAKLGIDDLRFHDLRHAGITALFRQGMPIQLVSIVSGHKSWENLKRYTQLGAADVHAFFNK